MASNHTEHFSLNQWLPDDQVKRTDFNEDNAKLDAALDALSGGLAEKAGQAAVSSTHLQGRPVNRKRRARAYFQRPWSLHR